MCLKVGAAQVWRRNAADRGRLTALDAWSLLSVCPPLALRKPPTGKMFRFGVHALSQFLGRIGEWPQYCSHILQISHLQQAHPELVQYIERVLEEQAAAAPAGGAVGAAGATPAAGGPPGLATAAAAGAPAADDAAKAGTAAAVRPAAGAAGTAAVSRCTALR